MVYSLARPLPSALATRYALDMPVMKYHQQCYTGMEWSGPPDINTYVTKIHQILTQVPFSEIGYF